MSKTIKILALFLFSFTAGTAQTLCPPAFLVASSGNTEVDLFWSPPDTAYYGDILVAECFSDCDSAAYAFTIEHTVDNNSGGWFRSSDGSPYDCGSGMPACADGGDDNYSAVAPYTDAAGVTIDSRLITPAIDLTSYTTATLEYTEGYTWSIDANDSNMVEISTDSGATWTQIAVSRPGDLYTETGALSDIVTRTVDCSSYAGQVVHIAFRYFDSVGYGEAWFVDNVRVWGGTGGRSVPATLDRVVGRIMTTGKKEKGMHYKTEFFAAPLHTAHNSSARTSPCGTFQSYNVYQDGAFIDNITTNEYTVTGLTNFQEYCYTVTAVYAEGESDTCFNACTSPSDPFIVTPVDIDVTVGVGELVTETISVTNNEEESLDYSIFSMEVANLEVATALMSENFDIGLWGEMYDPDVLWAISDSTGASSIYLIYPESEGLFAYYNDDVAGPDSIPINSYLTSNLIFINGDEKIYFMLDIFYPQLGGPCGTFDIDDGFYVDHSSLWISTDGGNEWIMIDSSYANMYAGWQKLLYNVTPYTTGNQILQVAVRYNDCGGHWGYGIGVDNVAVKVGDNYSWLTLTPVESTIGSGETIDITVGMYGVSDGFSASETAVMTATRADGSPAYEVNIDLSIQVGESGVDLPDGIPGVFALHQNYPNPFNPVTNIRFDIPELSFARMDIYNILGQRVRTLFHGAVEPGYHIAQWDGRSDLGEELPTGMYMYKLHAGSYIAMEKLVLLK